MLGMVVLLCAAVMAGSVQAIAQTRQDFTYDEAGRVSSVAFKRGNTTRLITYTYDHRNNLTAVETAVTVSVQEEVIDPAFTVRPNPASDHLAIDLSTFGDRAVTVEIHSRRGELVFKREITPGQQASSVELDPRAEGMASGTYLISVSAGGTRTSRTVVIAR